MTVRGSSNRQPTAQNCVSWLALLFAILLAIGGLSFAAGVDTTTANNNKNAISASLEQVDDLLAGWNRLEAQIYSVLESADNAVETLQALKKQRQKFDTQQAVVRDTWTTWNQQQIKNLRDNLSQVLEAETSRRVHAAAQVEEFVSQREHIKLQKAQAAAGETPSAPKKTPTPSRVLSWNEVKELMAPEPLLQERDERVGAWIAELLQQTMRTRAKPKWEWAQNVSSLATQSSSSGSNGAVIIDGDNDGSSGGASCWTLLDAVVHIQQALTNYSHDDGLGVTDHARGGRIAHHATSPTYAGEGVGSDGGAKSHHHHPKRSSSSKNTDSTTPTWGSSMLRKYVIAEDWEEYILSHMQGWQDWPLFPTQYLTHSWKRLLGVSTTAPTETVLQGATWPGACWPMQGDKGQVTIVLPYPIYPSAISVDHVSPLLVTEGDRESAPKTMRVFAYEACENNDCDGLEYDDQVVYDLFRGRTIEYDLNGNSVQTFWMPPQKAAAKEIDDDDEGPASCTAPEDEEGEEAMIASCSGEFAAVTPTTKIRAIQIQVLDNWGQTDYTCLYRIRVHGTPS